MLQSAVAWVNSNTVLIPPNTLTVASFKVTLLQERPSLGLQ